MLRRWLTLLPFWLCCFVNAAYGQTYTVMTYNVRYDNPLDSIDPWVGRREAIVGSVLGQKPDVIGFQEVLFEQLRFLDQHLPGYQRFGVGREDGIARGEFSPVYFDTATFALVTGRTLWLSPTPDIPSKGWDAACERIATYVVIRDKRNGDSLHFVNTHWDHVGEKARLNSARLVHELVSQPLARGAHVALLGDFNTTDESAELQALGKLFANCSPPEQRSRGTFNNFDTEAIEYPRIDHIFHSRGNWEVLRYSVPHPMVRGRHASDHFPVVVLLRALR